MKLTRKDSKINKNGKYGDEFDLISDDWVFFFFGFYGL